MHTDIHIYISYILNKYLKNKLLIQITPFYIDKKISSTLCWQKRSYIACTKKKGEGVGPLNCSQKCALG